MLLIGNRGRLVVATVALMAVLAAACGDDEDGDADDREGDAVDAPPATDAPDEPVELTASDIGVTESVVRVGAVFPDTTALNQDPGDIEAKFRTIADRINDEGGISGRMIELHFRSPTPLTNIDTDRVCTELTEDEEVFAAIGLFPRDTATCYGALHDTIVVNTFGIGPDEMATFTAPGLTLVAHPERLVEPRVRALVDGGVLEEGMRVAVLGADAAREGHSQYKEALENAGVDIVADTVLLADGTDLLAVNSEMELYAEVWRSQGAEAVVATTALLSQALLIGYNRAGVELPMILPEGTGVPPSLLQNTQGLDLAPFELAISLGDDDQPTKYENGTDGVQECVDDFTSASGEEVALDESRDNLAPTIVACQAFDVFVAIATAAGPNLTTESFREAAEAFGPIEITDLAAASVGPDKFDLNDDVGVITRFDPETLTFKPVE